MEYFSQITGLRHTIIIFCVPLIYTDNPTEDRMCSSIFHIIRHCIIWLMFSLSLVLLLAQTSNSTYDYQVDVCGARCLAFCWDEIDQNICDQCRRVEGLRYSEQWDNCYTELCPCYIDTVFGEHTLDWDDSATSARSLWNILAGLPTVHSPSSVWVTNVTGSVINLEWTNNPQPMPIGRQRTVLYLVLINETASETSISPYHYTNLTNEAHFTFVHGGSCMDYSAQVATVTWWQSAFSDIFNITIRAGKVPALNLYLGNRPIFRERSNEIMTTIIAAPPNGWLPEHIYSYEWKRFVKTTQVPNDMYPGNGNCPNIEFNEVYGNPITMRVHRNGFGCSFTIGVRAITSCGVYGNWSKFDVVYDDCAIVRGFPCPTTQPMSPGGVADVYVAFIPNMRLLWVQWEAPRELGSSAIVQRYIVRHGMCIRREFDVFNQILPHGDDLSIPAHGSQRIYSIVVRLDSSYVNSNALYGVKILALGPRTNISEAFEAIEAFCTAAPYRSLTRTLIRGNEDEDHDPIILYRQDDFMIYKTMNMSDTDIIIFWNKTNNVGQKRDEYMLQWGNVDDMDRSNNQSVRLRWDGERSVSKNPAILNISFQIDAPFFIKVKKLRSSHDITWDDVKPHFFYMPKVYTNETVIIINITQHLNETSSVSEESNPETSNDQNAVFLYVFLPVATVMCIILVAFLLVRRHDKLSYLNRRRQNVESEAYHLYNTIRYNDGNGGFILSCGIITPAVVADKWEIAHCSLEFGQILGQGAFGQVFKGRVPKRILPHTDRSDEECESTKMTVAIKLLLEGTEARYKNAFLKEIALMKNIGYHQNVVSMLGCCTLTDPICLIVEHVANGDLLTFLKERRAQMCLRDSVSDYANIITLADLLNIARQIAVGMEFLSQKGYVHRDLAARNVLIGDNNVVKVSDFGLARFIYTDKVYVNRKGGRLPLKWMSIEAIFDLTFSTASDVWSFGIVLFEIITLGGMPYPHLSHKDLVTELTNGYRMEQPDNCSQELYNVMLSCWSQLPRDRPSFTSLRDYLDSMLENIVHVEYVEFSLDTERDYYISSLSSADDDEAGDDNDDDDLDDVFLDSTSFTEIPGRRIPLALLPRTESCWSEILCSESSSLPPMSEYPHSEITTNNTLDVNAVHPVKCMLNSLCPNNVGGLLPITYRQITPGCSLRLRRSKSLSSIPENTQRSTVKAHGYALDKLSNRYVSSATELTTSSRKPLSSSCLCSTSPFVSRRFLCPDHYISKIRTHSGDSGISEMSMTTNPLSKQNSNL